MIEMLLLVAVLTLAGYAFYKWGIANNEYFAERNLPFMKPIFLFGNSGGFFTNKYSINDFVQYLYNAIPNEKIVGAFDLRTPLYILRDPEVIKQLTVKDFDYFADHRPFIDENVDSLFGNSLFMLRGEKWRDMRATLSPAFTGSKMRLMFNMVSECGHKMAEFFRKEAATGKHQDHEMKELFQRYANDVIASAAFGITVNSFEQRENEFFITGKRLVNFANFTTFVKVMVIRLMPWIMKALNISFIDGKAGKYFKSLVLDAMEYRQKNKIFRPDMINIMMKLKETGSSEAVAQAESKDGNVESVDGFATVEESSVGKAVVKRQWNDSELVAQCFLFFLAGFDTSSTTLGFIAHELALNPDVQDKLYAEIVATNGKLLGKNLTYDELQKMRYMDMVVSEGLRYWPPAGIIDRTCVKDYEYKDGNRQFKIEKGRVIWIPIFGLHCDPKYFPNPTKFDPERFSEENKDNIVAGTYLPFGVGPRNCIGSRFALMEVKAVLYYLLLSFKFEPNANTQIPLKLKKNATGISTEKGINLRLTLR